MLIIQNLNYLYIYICGNKHSLKIIKLNSIDLERVERIKVRVKVSGLANYCRKATILPRRGREVDTRGKYG